MCCVVFFSVVNGVISSSHKINLSLTVVGSCFPSFSITYTGFLQRLETLENESGHAKVMEHEKMTKSHGIL